MLPFLIDHYEISGLLYVLDGLNGALRKIRAALRAIPAKCLAIYSADVLIQFASQSRSNLSVADSGQHGGIIYTISLQVWQHKSAEFDSLLSKICDSLAPI